MIPIENKLDIYIPISQDIHCIAGAIRQYLKKFRGAKLYNFKALVDGELNLIGHAPRPVIEHLIKCQEVCGYRIVDHRLHNQDNLELDCLGEATPKNLERRNENRQERC